MNYRSNKEIESAVARGLQEAATKDLSSVLRKLAKEGVPRDVIQRVFIYPKIYRSTDKAKGGAYKT
ncbi:MAG TPA: hypothetical protein VFF74_12540 [Methylophilaceae bacterium]|nr:hypothetical protein [Methylophilaceae bacterium]